MFLLRQTCENIPVDGPVLREKTKGFCICLSTPWCYPSLASSCKSCNGFCCFSREGLKNISLTGNRALSDMATADFLIILKAVIEEGYTRNTIFNMDETVLQLKHLPSTTYVSHQEKQAYGRKVDKSCYTIVYSNATAPSKCVPFLFKRPRNHTPSEI